MTYTAQSTLSRAWPLFILLFTSLVSGLASIVAPPQEDPPPSSSDIFQRVIANQKRMEANLDIYERIQKVEIRKTGGDTNPSETKVWRIIPSGPTVNKISLSPSGQPISQQSYRAELEKLAKYLAWAAQTGPSQRDAYAKMERKRKDRYDLISSTHEAFLFTPVGNELRANRTLTKYRMTPNPKFKPTTRNAVIFSKVSGYVWVDQESGELARIEGSVTEDISIAMFLAKVYKGSYFMQERYEIVPGLWLPTYEQYDFDGRKFLLSFSIHERTFYSDYKRVGPPAEAVNLIRAELDKLSDH